MEFLLHKKNLWILFYFDHAGCTNVDRRLMRYFIRYNRVRKRAKWSEPCVLGCYPGILLARDFQRWSRKKKLSFSRYNKSFIDRDMLDTGLCSFCVLTVLEFVSVYQKSTHIHARKNTKKSVANIQTSWPHAWSETHICWTSITLSPCWEISELSGKFPRVARFCCCRFSPSVPSLMHKTAFARDLSHLVPKGLTIAPH